MMTKQMQDLEHVCKAIYGGNYEKMINVYERVINLRKKKGDVQNIKVLESDLSTLKDLLIFSTENSNGK